MAVASDRAFGNDETRSVEAESPEGEGGRPNRIRRCAT